MDDFMIKGELTEDENNNLKNKIACENVCTVEEYNNILKVCIQFSSQVPILKTESTTT